MPWDVVKQGSKWVVVSRSGNIMGTHKSKGEARKQQKALYAAEGLKKSRGI